ncbi:hypothetical protein [Sphingomonas sp. MMS24-J13]|uniref:hypothetical protein n=1 Tax=Sphingomonas sp. MMS24-J13 TaxID=3238686 RepID=UPI00384DC10B
MADLVKYSVARAHLGDRLTDDGVVQHHFQEGESREANPGVVAQLVKSGVLVDPSAKAEGNSAQNKADPNTGGKNKAAAK